MTRDEIKSAVEFYDEIQQVSKHEQTLLDLATSVLNAEMPKKSTTVPLRPEGHLNVCGCGACRFVDDLVSRNKLIDDCTLAHTRILLEKEEDLEVMEGFNKMNFEHIEQLQQELAKLKLEISHLENVKSSYRQTHEKLNEVIKNLQSENSALKEKVAGAKNLIFDMDNWIRMTDICEAYQREVGKQAKQFLEGV